MSCYTRHLGDLMVEVGIAHTKENRKLIDLWLREILGYSTTDECQLVWREVKRWLTDASLKQEMMRKLKQKLEESH